MRKGFSRRASTESAFRGDKRGSVISTARKGSTQEVGGDEVESSESGSESEGEQGNLEV